MGQNYLAYILVRFYDRGEGQTNDILQRVVKVTQSVVAEIRMIILMQKGDFSKLHGLKSWPVFVSGRNFHTLLSHQGSTIKKNI